MIIQIKSPSELWAKLKSFYITKSFTNKWYLKKQLNFITMVDYDSLQFHLNKFNKVAIYLLNANTKVEHDNKTLPLIGS